MTATAKALVVPKSTLPSLGKEGSGQFTSANRARSAASSLETEHGATDRMQPVAGVPLLGVFGRDGEGHGGSVSQFAGAPSSLDNGGHHTPATQPLSAADGSAGEGGHLLLDSRLANAASPDAVLHAQLAHYARQYLDIQKVRVALSNRSGALEREFGPQAAVLDAAGGQVGDHMDLLTQAEKTVGRRLERLVRQHFMADWVKVTRGFGSLQFALLMGVTAGLDGFASPAKVWKYVGMDVRPDGRAPRRVKGQAWTRTTAEVKGTAYSPQGRVLCHLIGDTIVKVGGSGPYRADYDRKKAEYLARERVGPSECPFGQEHKEKGGKVVKCGLAHAHNAAMRYATKRLLRDLWAEWKRRRAIGLVQPFMGLPAAV